MKTLFKIFFLLLSTLMYAQSDAIYFTEKPTLTPDGKSVIYSYQGDLWRVSSDGGEAARITAMDGTETDPSVSPNGKWLAFTSNQYGNNDVYIMPIEGGVITQLTFHQSSDTMTSWSWDSDTIYFTSDRYNSRTSYSIARTGGTPIRLFDHYFNTIHNLVEHPKTKDLYFNESWESSNFANRKRYKGDYNPDIKSYNPTTKKYTQHTDYRGKDFAATIDKNGNIYFISDESNGEYNLYTFDNGTKKRLTNFSTSIMWPKVSANGEKIVFRKDYQLFVYDVSRKSTKKLTISSGVNVTINKEQSFNVDKNISNFDISPDTKKIAFVSRGKLFVSDVAGKFVKEIATNPLEAIQEVKWLKNNTTLLFSQTYKGYYNWFTINADGNSEEKQLTKDAMNSRNITFNDDATKAVFIRGRNELCLLDLNSLKSDVIVKDEFWGFYNSDPYFSPDGAYILYNAYRDFETDVFVYNIHSKTTMNLTKTKVSESSPFWSPDGKYVYFASDRINPSFPSGATDSKIYQMALERVEKPFKSSMYNELFAKKDSTKKSSKKTNVTVTINPENTMKRLSQISPNFGSQSNVSVIKEGDKTYVLYTSNHSEGRNTLWVTTLEPFENNKTTQVSKSFSYGYQLISRGKKHFMLLNGVINTFNVSGNKLTPITINHSFNKSLSNEFSQMYYEAWAGMEENFYDENFHGENWQKLRDSYATYLPYIASRANLRLIFNDMLGELNTSHFGFNSNGKEEQIYYGTRTLATGIIFDNKQPFVVDRIVTDSPTDYADKNIQKGDVLVAVNNQRIAKNSNREQYFTSPNFSGELQLTFLRNKQEFTVNVHPTSYTAVRNLMYDEWQNANQDYVNKKSNHKIAYVHMKNMSGGELTKFKEDLVSDEAYKDGLILDLRYNTGGNVHDEVLRFLSQKTYLNWKYREGKLTGQSNFNYGNKPIVLLINEQSLSDAEMTAAGFKELGLGTVVGTETYRWIIFTSSKSLVDGSSYRLPSWGCYTLDGKDLELTGVKPDVYVPKGFIDRLENKTPQLDKAIDIILKQLQ